MVVPVNNPDERSNKPEQSLRTPLDETKMKPVCDQQMAFLLTLKSIASSFEKVDTRESPKSQRAKQSKYCELNFFRISLKFKESVMQVVFDALLIY